MTPGLAFVPCSKYQLDLMNAQSQRMIHAAIVVAVEDYAMSVCLYGVLLPSLAIVSQFVSMAFVVSPGDLSPPSLWNNYRRI